jgi:hypothetical protein
VVKDMSAFSLNNSKYTITNKYDMTEDEVNLIATKSLVHITSRALDDEK